MLQTIVWGRPTRELCSAGSLEYRRPHNHSELTFPFLTPEFAIAPRCETMGWWWWAGREPILKSSSITQICSPDTGFKETKVVTALFNFISQEQHTSSHRMDWQWRCLKSSKISYCNSHFTVLVLLSNALNLKIKRKHFGGDQNTFGTPKFGFASSWQESRFSDSMQQLSYDWMYPRSKTFLFQPPTSLPHVLSSQTTTLA